MGSTNNIYVCLSLTNSISYRKIEVKRNNFIFQICYHLVIIQFLTLFLKLGEEKQVDGGVSFTTKTQHEEALFFSCVSHTSIIKHIHSYASLAY